MLKTIKKLISLQKDVELLKLGFLKLVEEVQKLKGIDDETLKKLQNDLKTSTAALESAVSTAEKTHSVTITST